MLYQFPFAKYCAHARTHTHKYLGKKRCPFLSDAMHPWTRFAFHHLWMGHKHKRQSVKNDRFPYNKWREKARHIIFSPFIAIESQVLGDSANTRYLQHRCLDKALEGREGEKEGWVGEMGEQSHMIALKALSSPKRGATARTSLSKTQIVDDKPVTE